jgi:hypothetical protein
MKTARTKKPSGENIPEAMRKTEALKLRLPPDVAATIRECAGNAEMGMSEWVVALIMTMRARPDAMACELLEDLRPAPK